MKFCIFVRTINLIETMRQISLTLNDNEFDKFMDSLKSFKSANILKSKHVDSDLPQWQKDELDKSITEIENGTVQSEEWSTLRDSLFTQYSVK